MSLAECHIRKVNNTLHIVLVSWKDNGKITFPQKRAILELRILRLFKMAGGSFALHQYPQI